MEEQNTTPSSSSRTRAKLEEQEPNLDEEQQCKEELAYLCLLSTWDAWGESFWVSLQSFHNAHVHFTLQFAAASLVSRRRLQMRRS
jgi:hypothetical protein